jgi:hypothetical protein
MLAFGDYFPTPFLHKQAGMFLPQEDADGDQALFAAQPQAGIDADVD